MMAEGGVPETSKQKEEIEYLARYQLKRGDTWYLIDSRWFKQLKRYIGSDQWDTFSTGEQTANPGPIDNSALLDSDGKLKEHLIDELDYNIVCEEAWNKLKSWYGLAEGQEPLARVVIEQGMFVKHCKVEVYYIELKLSEDGDQKKAVTKQFSRADTVETVEQAMRAQFDISNNKEVRLWNKYMSNTYEQLKTKETSLQDSGLYNGQIIVIEQKNEDGTWPRQSKKGSAGRYGSTIASQTTSSSSAASTSNSMTYGNGGSSYYGNYEYSSGKGHASKPGLCGLSNLGNTCFMNSALQCMSNVPPLTRYFLEDKWIGELNEDNPLGMKGEIAKSYADLIKHIWSGNYSHTVPRGFKIAVGHFAPQFSGFQQQDSQELMAFLLDGLHEDLNRIKKKPYIEQTDANGRPDEEVAAEAWDIYQKRNDSIVVDIFHGQLKSTLICPDCNKVSVTFDPFCYLSLPLPYKKERQLEVFLVPADPAKIPVQYKLTVPKNGCVNDLCKSLSKLTNVSSEKMVVTDVYNHRFHKVFSAEEGLSHILDRDDIFVYEVPVASGDDPETLVLPVYLRVRKNKPGYTNGRYTTCQLFGQPLLVALPRKNCSYQDLHNSIIKRMGRYVQEPTEADEWWKDEQQEVNGEVEMRAESSDTEDMSENSKQEGEINDEVDGRGSSEDQEGQDCKPCMFTFQLVNSYGSSEVQTIEDDGKPLKLTTRSYIAIDWHEKAKGKFYDEALAEEIKIHASVNQRIMPRKQTIQLNDCLELFTSSEVLGEHDLWYCPTCKDHKQATKKFDIWSLPNVLVIHLKRFSYNRYWRDKLDTLVEFPAEGLDLSKYIINKRHDRALYDLIGVSNHYGGMGGGHYTAYCHSPLDEKWYYFDDSSVSSSNEESVCTKAAYVLVYKKRGMDTGVLPSTGSSVDGTLYPSNDNDDSNKKDDQMDVY